MLEYRPVPDEDLEEFRRLVSYAFRPTEAYEPVDSPDDLPEPATVGDRRGIYEDGELCSVCAHHWFTLRVRDEFHAAPGLSAVSTPPRHRRRGLVRRLLSESLREYRDRDAGVSVLWPFEHPFYRRFGWGTCSRHVRATCEPEALAELDATTVGGVDRTADRPDATSTDADGEFVDLGADEWEALDRVYRATNDQGLAMSRTEEWWRKRVFAGWDRDPYVAGWERNGRLAGYLVYTIDEPADGDSDGRRMDVRELGYTDFEAYRHLLRFCGYHDSQVGSVRLYGPVDTTIQDLVSDPRDVELEIEPGPMVRLVDVRRALGALSYPASMGGEVVIEVEDDLAEWNDGRFRLSVADGRTTVERTDDDSEVVAGVPTLSQVVVGHYSVARAERVGTLTLGSDEARSTLAGLFPPEETFLREFF